MLIVLEIILTISAWNRGWKWMALLPLGLLLVIGFLWGASIGANGGNINDIPGMLQYGLDIIGIIALILMCVFPKKLEEKTEE